MQSKFILSALCLALLTACNNDGPSLLNDDNGRPGFLGTDNSKRPVPPADRDNTVMPVNKMFRLDSDGMGGQQNSPTVVALDSNNNGLIDTSDRIGFDQPGIVSTFCEASGSQQGCEAYSKVLSTSKNLTENIAQKKSELIEQNKALAKAQAEAAAAQKVVDNAKRNPATGGSSTLAAAQDALDQAKQAVEEAKLEVAVKEAELKAAVDTFNSSGVPLIAPETGIIMLDVNNDYHTVVLSNTIDKKSFPTTSQPDAGVTKVDYERIRHANGQGSSLTNARSIGREFNEVVVFAKDRSSFTDDGVPEFSAYLDSYFRAPSTANWSYQTFGNFHNNNLHSMRGVNVGYQSVGTPTKVEGMSNLEKNYGPAVYTGIAHAYYNDNQVTMRNKIVANFSKRELTYETTEAATYHTFEAPGGVEGSKGEVHVIEKRPDLNLSGKATWQKSTSEFEGKIRAANGLEGRIEGRFYGPQAEEIGGVFGLEGEQKNQHVQYVGGFGGSRQ